MLSSLVLCSALFLLHGSSPAPAARIAACTQDASLEESIERIHQLHADGDLARGLEQAQAFTELHPESARGWGLLSFLTYMEGEEQAARGYYAKGAAIDENAPEVVLMDVWLMVLGPEEVDPGVPFRRTTLALEDYPEAPLLIELHGGLLHNRGDYEQAIEVFVDGLEFCATERQVFMMLDGAMNAATQDEQWDLVEAVLNRVMEMRDVAEDQIIRVVLQLTKGLYRDALEAVARIFGRSDVQNSRDLQEAAGELRDSALQQYAEQAGPIVPLCWMLRWQPGDDELERRIVEQVESIRAAGPDHPRAQLAPPADAEAEAARGEFPSSLFRDRLLVHSDVVNELPAYRRAGDWQGASEFLTAQLALYPDSAAYLARSLVHAHARDWAGALADADIAEAMEAVECSEDSLRAAIVDTPFSLTSHVRDLTRALRKLAAGEPGEAESLVLAALALQDKSDWFGAYESYQQAQAVELDHSDWFVMSMKDRLVEVHGPEIEAAYVLLGDRALQAGDIPEAERIADVLLWQSVGNVDGLLFRARLARQFEDFEGLQKNLERVLSEAPFHPVAHLQLGQLASERGDTGRALLHFSAGSGPTSDQAGVAQLSGARGECAELRARLEPQLPPEEVYALYAEATREVLTSDASNSLAVAGFTRLLELGGPRAQLLAFRSELNLQLKRPAEAVADAELVLAEPDATPEQKLSASRSLAAGLESGGRLEEAAEAYGRLAELAPDDPSPRERQGSLLHSTGEIDGAIEAFEQAVARGSRNADARMELAECLALQSRWMDASDAAGQASQLAVEIGDPVLGHRATRSSELWFFESLESMFGE